MAFLSFVVIISRLTSEPKKEGKMSVGLSDQFEDDLMNFLLNTLVPIDDDDIPDPDGDGGLPVPVGQTNGLFI